ncbi:MAG: hypothetical protein K8S98_02315 [Planctomycetes bacterium]|nr:hypothetical protein [Planctomycetota bacterium]
MLALALSVSIAASMFAGGDRPLADPVRTDVQAKFAGTLDLRTQQFHRGVYPHVTDASTRIYFNETEMCNVAYQPLSPGEMLLDEGRVPSPWPGLGWTCYAVDAIYVGYMTAAPTGTVDIDFDLFDTGTLPDPCSTSTAYAGQAPILSFDSSITGFPLPGSTGGLTAWIVAFSLPVPVTMNGGATSSDLFHWAMRQNNPPVGGLLGGPILSGDPTAAAPGTGTFLAPPVIESPCSAQIGTGLDTVDSYWLQSGSTGSCLSYGGYPSNRFASFCFAIDAASACSTMPCGGNVLLDVIASGGVLDLSVKNQVVVIGDVVSWHLPNALAHTCDSGLLDATWLRVRFPNTNPTTGPATVDEPIAALGGFDTYHCATISASATLGASFYDIEILDQNLALLCTIDPTLIVGSPAESYCTAKVNSKGCTPATSTTGIPQVGLACSTTFQLQATSLIGAKNGQWFYSGVGSFNSPFLGGLLCVKPQIKRLPVQSTGGSGSNCSGALTTNFNARICSGLDPQLTAGKQIWAQAYHRDNGFAAPNNVALTDGLTFVICP